MAGPVRASEGARESVPRKCAKSRGFRSDDRDRSIARKLRRATAGVFSEYSRRRRALGGTSGRYAGTEPIWRASGVAKMVFGCSERRENGLLAVGPRHGGRKSGCLGAAFVATGRTEGRGRPAAMALLGHRNHRDHGWDGNLSVPGGHRVVGCRRLGGRTILHARPWRRARTARDARRANGRALRAGNFQWQIIRLALA